MSQEKYQPSPEEIKQAEEMMTNRQKRASEEREELAHRVQKETGMPGHLTYNEYRDELDYNTSEIEGVIRGHELRVINGAGSPQAWIDGVKTTREIARALWNKYGKDKSLAIDLRKQKIDDKLTEELFEEDVAQKDFKNNESLRGAIEDLLKVVNADADSTDKVLNFSSRGEMDFNRMRSFQNTVGYDWRLPTKKELIERGLNPSDYWSDESAEQVRLSIEIRDDSSESDYQRAFATGFSGSRARVLFVKE